MATQLSYGLNRTASGALKQTYFSDEERATMASFISFASVILRALAFVALGMLVDAIGEANGLMVFAVIVIPVSFVYIHLIRKTEKKAKSNS